MDQLTSDMRRYGWTTACLEVSVNMMDARPRGVDGGLSHAQLQNQRCSSFTSCTLFVHLVQRSGWNQLTAEPKLGRPSRDH